MIQLRRSGAPGRTAAVAVGAAILLAACSSGGSDEAASDSAAPPVDQWELSEARVADSQQQLDEIVATIQQDTGVPGIAVGVVYDGQPVIASGYGVTEAGTDANVTPQTVFQLASLSKPVGATAIAGVVGRGDIEWNQPVVTELPDFELSDAYVTENATVADFYSHRTGLPGDSAGNDLETIGYDQEQILQRLRYLPLEPFRATYSYSNFGMTVGGAAAAAAYGAPFAQMSEEVLFEPAGMTATSFRNEDFEQQADAAVLHARIDGEFVPLVKRNPDAQAPAGGVSSNVDDMNRWMMLNLNGGQLDGEQIVDADALAETKRLHINSRQEADPADPVSGYGLGWNVGQAMAEPSLTQWSHSGAFSAGASTTTRLLPEIGLGVVVLTNAQPVGAAEAIADTYIDVLLHGEASMEWARLWGENVAPLLEPLPVETPADPAPQRADDAYLGTYANDYVGDAVVRAAAQGNGLELAMGPGGASVFPLEHLEGDRFTFADFPEIPDSRTVLQFRFDGGTQASELVLENSWIFGPNSEDTPWTVLTRVG